MVHRRAQPASDVPLPHPPLPLVSFQETSDTRIQLLLNALHSSEHVPGVFFRKIVLWEM